MVRMLGTHHMSNTLNIPQLTGALSKITKSKSSDGISCLRSSLRAAIQIEFATIPPYLTAFWSIRESSPVADTIKEIALEEMLHMGLACNMLVGLGESPDFLSPGCAPSYPGPLPGNVSPTLSISLRRLSPSQLKTFMDIEYPEGGPISITATRKFPTLGAFYAALLTAFEVLDPPFDVACQRDVFFAQFHLFPIADIADVRKAINLIRHQGEGSNTSPEESPGHLAHFYQFREAYEGSKYIKDPLTNTWTHTGAPVLMPQVWPMADIPPGGYQKVDVTSEVWQKINDFDATYTKMLQQLQVVWIDPNASFGDFGAGDPILTMFGLGSIAKALMQKDRPDRRGSYGPCFRVI